MDTLKYRIYLSKLRIQLGMVTNVYSPGTPEINAGESGIQGQPGLQNEILLQQTNI